MIQKDEIENTSHAFSINGCCYIRPLIILNIFSPLQPPAKLTNYEIKLRTSENMLNKSIWQYFHWRVWQVSETHGTIFGRKDTSETWNLVHVLGGPMADHRLHMTGVDHRRLSSWCSDQSEWIASILAPAVRTRLIIDESIIHSTTTQYQWSCPENATKRHVQNSWHVLCVLRIKILLFWVSLNNLEYA